MIKTPVKRCIVTDKITDAEGCIIIECADVGCTSDIEMRINSHDKLKESVTDLMYIVGELEERHGDQIGVCWMEIQRAYHCAKELMDRKND